MILYVKYGENHEKDKKKKDLILNISNYKKVKHKIESIWINSQKKIKKKFMIGLNRLTFK
jgi:hypothetical protein